MSATARVTTKVTGIITSSSYLVIPASVVSLTDDGGQSCIYCLLVLQVSAESLALDERRVSPPGAVNRM